MPASPTTGAVANAVGNGVTVGVAVAGTLVDVDSGVATTCMICVVGVGAGVG